MSQPAFLNKVQSKTKSEEVQIAYRYVNHDFVSRKEEKKLIYSQGDNNVNIMYFFTFTLFSLLCKSTFSVKARDDTRQQPQ